MKPSLNYSKRDLKFILLDEIFKIIDGNRALNIYARNGIKNCKMMVICIKLIFLSMFFDYTVSGVIDEVNIENGDFSDIEPVSASEPDDPYGTVSESKLYEY